MVPSEGVEPPCLAALGSKPSVSANSTNWAQTNDRGTSCSQKTVEMQRRLDAFFVGTLEDPKACGPLDLSVNRA